MAEPSGIGHQPRQERQTPPDYCLPSPAGVPVLVDAATQTEQGSGADLSSLLKQLVSIVDARLPDIARLQSTPGLGVPTPRTPKPKKKGEKRKQPEDLGKFLTPAEASEKIRSSIATVPREIWEEQDKQMVQAWCTRFSVTGRNTEAKHITAGSLASGPNMSGKIAALYAILDVEPATAELTVHRMLMNTEWQQAPIALRTPSGIDGQLCVDLLISVMLAIRARRNATWTDFRRTHLLYSPVCFVTSELLSVACERGLLRRLDASASITLKADTATSYPDTDILVHILGVLNQWTDHPQKLSFMEIRPPRLLSSHDASPSLAAMSEVMMHQAGGDTLAAEYTKLATPWRSTRDLLHDDGDFGDASSWFRTDDMDIDSLQRIGKVRIKWSNAADHLKLNVADSASSASSCDTAPSEDLGTTLHLAWYDSVESAELAAFFFGIGPVGDRSRDCLLEIRRSWAFLFHPNSIKRRRKVREAYRDLPAPPELADLMGKPGSKTYKLGDFIDKRGRLETQCFEISQHQNHNQFRYNFFKKSGFNYSLFPIYERRLRELREYMDEQKPTTLFEMLRDKRNTREYYAIVGVLVVAVIGLLLAFLSLLVGILQAWASISALHAH